MKLIVGLGNPGEKYDNTRHNLGFMIMDKFIDSAEGTENSWKYEEKLKAEVCKINYLLNANNYSLLLIKPQTFMNNSGLALRLLADYYHIPAEDIIIIHDDLDLPLGQIKIRIGGSAAGHHGVESIIKSLDNDQFIRVRLGIGVGKSFSGEHKEVSFNAEHFVLEPFTSQERPKVKQLIKHTIKALEILLSEGLEKAQNQFN